MSKHTPRPWTAFPAQEDMAVHKSLRPCWYADVRVGPMNTAGNVIARVHMGADGAITNTVEAVEANAKLIAAAPELLAAAKLAEAVLARGGWLDTSTDPEAVALRALRQAIAKATGEQP